MKDFLKSSIRLIPLFYIIIFFIFPIFRWIFFDEIPITASQLIHPPFLKQLQFTVYIAFLTSLFSVCLSYPLAIYWYVNKKSKKANRLSFLIFVPLIVGLLTRNYSWMSLLSFTSLSYSLTAVVLVMVYIFIPLNYFILIQGFENISDNAIESAKIMGATLTQSFIRVVFPQTIRHVYIALFFVFANSLCYYITPKMVGGGKYDMTGNIIWRFLDKGLFSDASAISLIFIIYLSPVFILALYFILKRRHLLLAR